MPTIDWRCSTLALELGIHHIQKYWSVHISFETHFNTSHKDLVIGNTHPPCLHTMMTC